MPQVSLFFDSNRSKTLRHVELSINNTPQQDRHETETRKFCNYFLDVRVLTHFLRDDTASQTREALLNCDPISINKARGNDGEWFLGAEFSSRSQAMHCFAFCQKDPLLSINTNVLTKREGKIQSIWNQPEKRIVKQLKAKLRGKTEACTPAGRIDLLTENQLIEVKPKINWKSGLGQLLAYGRFYPQHLFDKIPSKNTDKIVKFCQNVNIKSVFVVDLGFDHNSDFCAVELNHD